MNLKVDITNKQIIKSDTEVDNIGIRVFEGDVLPINLSLYEYLNDPSVSNPYTIYAPTYSNMSMSLAIGYPSLNAGLTITQSYMTNDGLGQWSGQFSITGSVLAGIQASDSASYLQIKERIIEGGNTIVQTHYFDKIEISQSTKI